MKLIHAKMFEVSFCIVQQSSYLLVQNEAWYTNKILLFPTQVYIGVRKAEKRVVSSHFIWNSAFLSKFCSRMYLFHLEYVSAGNYTKYPHLKACWAGLDL